MEAVFRHQAFDWAKAPEVVEGATDQEVTEAKRLVAILMGERGRSMPQEGYPEVEVTLAPEGIPVIGYIDLLSTSAPASDLNTEIIDYKTKSHPKWVLRESEMLYDVQLLIYAKAVCDMYKLEGVWVGHRNAFRFMSSPVETVRQYLSKEHIEEQFKATIIPALRRIKELYQAPDAPSRDEVRMNRESCGDFGGCWYKKVGLCSPEDDA
jgi:RecB family exonuclease